MPAHSQFHRTVIKGIDLDPKNKSSLIEVLSPISFALSAPKVPKDFFLECQGPIRQLSVEEYIELVRSKSPDAKFPEQLLNAAKQVKRALRH